MTKRIVSGVFLLIALGALGLILAGALTSGEQLIVRFLTAIIVAALGLYVISDLRLQANDNAVAAGTRTTMSSPRVTTGDRPPANSTAAFMATVTGKRSSNTAAIDEQGWSSDADATDAWEEKGSSEPTLKLASRVRSGGSTANQARGHGPQHTEGESATTFGVYGDDVEFDDFDSIDAADEEVSPYSSEISAASDWPFNGESDSRHGDSSRNGDHPFHDLDRGATALVEKTDQESAHEAGTIDELTAESAESSTHQLMQRSTGYVAGPPTDHTIERPNGLVAEPSYDHMADQVNGNVELRTGEMAEPSYDQMFAPQTGRMFEPSIDQMAEPQTGEVIEPSYDQMFEPQTGEVIEPSYDQMFEPPTGEVTNPSNDQVAEQATGEMAEPSTGEMAEPSTGEMAEPSTGEVAEQLTEEATGEIVEQATGEIVEQATEQLTEQATGEMAEQATGEMAEPSSDDRAAVDRAGAPVIVSPANDDQPTEVGDFLRPGIAIGSANGAHVDATLKGPITGSKPAAAKSDGEGRWKGSIIKPTFPLEAASYAEKPIAPIIDLRLAHTSSNPSNEIDHAIQSSEVEVISSLIEQGVLSAKGPISDRDVRTMVYVAFTSSELRKILLAGGSLDGDNSGIDLGDVDVFPPALRYRPKALGAGPRIPIDVRDEYGPDSQAL